MKQHWDEYNSILCLWKGKEEEKLHFSEIVTEMAKKGWYSKKVNRRLDEMVEQHILAKEKKGIRGAESRYSKTCGAKDFDAIRFFEDIRESCTKKQLVIKDCLYDNDSLLVYGIPKKEKLTPIEREILHHLLKQIDDAFENLLRLKVSIKARETVGAPLHIELIMNYAREKAAKILGDLVMVEAEQKAVEDYRRRRKKEKCSGLVANIPDIIENFSKCLDDTGKAVYQKLLVTEYFDISQLSKQEKMNDNDKILHCGSTDYVKESDAHLAILKTLPPVALEEYELNPYKQLSKLIDGWTPYNSKENDDADIFYMAEAFFRLMATGALQNTLTLEQIAFLAGLAELSSSLKGSVNLEKLIRCIFHFWVEHQNMLKTIEEQHEKWLKFSPEEQQKLMEPRDLTIEYGNPPIPQERITPEILAATKTQLPPEIEREFAKNRYN